MESRKYYNEILDDTATIDKMIVHLENMISEAPNARTRSLAQSTLGNINLIIAICEELKKRDL